MKRTTAWRAEIRALKALLQETKTILTEKLKRSEARIIKLESEIRMAEENDAMGPLPHSKKIFCVGCQQFMVGGPDQRKAPGRLPRAGSAGPGLRPPKLQKGFSKQWLH